MVKLSPKELFQANTDQMTAFGNMAHSPVMQIAISLALTHFSLEDNPTAEQMQGAKLFIKRLLNIAERDEAPPAQPVVTSIASKVPKREQPPQPKPRD